MRKLFSNTVEELAKADKSILFLTGDLGFSAFENLQQTLGERFINMGVAEQNMVSAAAGMAQKGFKVFCYSIAPFIVYRCLEQFRNDVCFHNLPVFLVGNGGGYGYGIMGSSHHALEDIACLSGMQNTRTWVPAFSEDVKDVIHQIVEEAKPTYLRLGLGKPSPAMQTKSGSFHAIMQNNNTKGTIIAMGPIVNNVIGALQNNELKNKFNLLTAVSFPLVLDADIIGKISESGNLLVVEEHIATGGLGEQLVAKLLEHGVRLNKFISLTAKGYPNGTYGDQGFHQLLSGLDVDSITSILRQLL